MLSLARIGPILDLGASRRWDRATLAREVATRATTLADAGITSGARVAIAHGGSASFFADLFAVWRLGATAACLDPTLTDSELNNVLQFLQPAVLLAGDAPLPERLPVPMMRLADASTRARAPGASAAAAGDAALILFTSGTTGTPKGVVLSYGALQTRLALNVAAIGKPVLARALLTLPTHFGHGLIGNALTPLLAGGELVLHPPGLPLAQNLARIIDEHRITFMSSVPALWRFALKLSHPPARGSLRRVHVGSAPLPAELWSAVAAWSRAEVVNCYGMTETANWVAGASSTDGIEDGLVGKMWGGVAAVLDAEGRMYTQGEGEIVVQTPSLMSSYFRRDDLTEAVLREGWYRTGDRGTLDKGGVIRLNGRVKDEINRGGFKVQPAEIDALLVRHPAVADACAFAIADPVSGEIVGAAVAFKSGTDMSPEMLRAWCRQRLRREAVPERWYVVEAIPRSARGKLDRAAVRRAVTKAP